MTGRHATSPRPEWPAVAYVVHAAVFDHGQSWWLPDVPPAHTRTRLGAWWAARRLTRRGLSSFTRRDWTRQWEAQQ